MTTTSPSPLSTQAETQHPIAEIKILRATKEDISTLGAILTSTHSSELVMSFFFPGWPDTAAMVPYHTGRIAATFASGSRDEVFKAIRTLPGGNGEEEIVGLVRMTPQNGEKNFDRGLVVKDGGEGGGESEEGVQEEVKMKLANVVGAPEGVNMRFVGEMMNGLGKLDEVMLGREHYLLSSLAVSPTHQNHGIGKKLMQHCHSIADRAGLPIYLTAFPGAHGMYLKLGYADTGHFDVDLNEWAREKWTGYGIYRSYGMVREFTGESR